MSFLKKLAAVAGTRRPAHVPHQPFADQDSQNICQFFLEDLPAMEAGMLDAAAAGHSSYRYVIAMNRAGPCFGSFSGGYTMHEYLDILIGEWHEDFLKEWFDGIDGVSVPYDKHMNKCEFMEYETHIDFSWPSSQPSSPRKDSKSDSE